MNVVARAPGRVNLIGDHTDYTGGWVLPMAVDLATTVEGERGGDVVRLSSDQHAEPAVVALDASDPASVAPPWARYVAGVIAVVRPNVGFRGTVRSDVPVGAGLSSSAALEVAVALALGFDGPAVELALACQRAEHLAAGVPCGVMDQLASAAGVDGHALLIDCTSLAVTAVRVPEDVQVVVVDSRQPRALAASPYAERRRQCEQAATLVGPLREASVGSVEVIADPLLRRRARHVVTENARVLAFAKALRTGDTSGAGRLMIESHASLRDDFEVSTPALDRLVDELSATAGVHGARLTGAGFGGVVVALVERGAPVPGRRLYPSAGATVVA